MKIKFFILIPFLLVFNFSVLAHHNEFDSFINNNAELIIKSSSKTVDTVLNNIQKFESPLVSNFLELWKLKNLYFIKETRKIIYIKEKGDLIEAFEIDGITKIGIYDKKEIKKIKPNSGVRAKIDTLLVKYQIFNPDLTVRKKSIASLSRNIEPDHLPLLRKASNSEQNSELKDEIDNLLRFAVIKYSSSEVEKLDVINSFENNTNIAIRASLNQLLNSSDILVADTLPANKNIARVIVPGLTTKESNGSAGRIGILKSEKYEISINSAYDLLFKNNLVKKKRVTKENIKLSLKQNIKDNKVGEFPVHSLNDDKTRSRAYEQLAAKNLVSPYVSENEIEKVVSQFVFYSLYLEDSSNITNAALRVLSSINLRVQIYKYIDLFVDGLSLASIYFLGAIGLAITFGVMRVINMAHGEFIMMGAYTGYVVQQFISNHTLSLLIALPLAFFVTFTVGIIMERLVIRHLYKKPLDTLLATFGISIALQQIAKNIFGTQARPLTSPSWLDGSLSLSDDLSISYIRVAIFILSLIFLALLLYVMKRTRLGLETRAVTQNPIMAANMGINPERINMITFGFGSGIAGIAGIAIGLFSKVTSELGSEYIVQSFMTVVVGGVGNIWGTLAGASLIGFLQKFIEWFNPSNTLAAQTYMIIFIILFIQFRPKGIVALKGRAADE